jgi:hypothetical protein
MLLSCCPKNSQDAAVLAALKAVQDAEKNHPHKDQVQRLIPINGSGRRFHLLELQQKPRYHSGDADFFIFFFLYCYTSCCK